MKTRTSQPPTAWPDKPPVAERPLLSETQSIELMALFKILGNDTRLRLLHALTKAEQMCVTELADAVEMKLQAVSNQLQRLVDRRIVRRRRDGNNIYYQIVDPCVVHLLDYGLCLTEDARAGVSEASDTASAHEA